MIDINQIKEALIIIGLLIGLPASWWGWKKSRSETIGNISEAEARLRADLERDRQDARTERERLRGELAEVRAQAIRAEQEAQRLRWEISTCPTPGCGLRARLLSREVS